jgi:alpha-amylase/alpha-mannosidase (GH57 family)
MTRVALLWHMHQPFYRDLVTGEHILPWVRLHAIKDYWGMAALLEEFPGVRCTFNLVPSMLLQLEAFAREEAHDRHLEIGLKPADQLTDEERGFCLEQFFHAHRPQMIDPFPRYAELLAWRGSPDGLRSRVSQFSTGDYRDLQVWHKLVWIDASYFEHDERIRALVHKGRNFSEDDKRTLRLVELEILQRVIPEYRRASERRQVELSTSPFYHPILPLLCDTDVYLRTHPHSRMPRERFQHPEDALEQLSRAVAYHERLFGSKPSGIWPSEGSVSDAMVPLVAQAGLQWMATDEEILARTLGRGFSRDGHGNVEQPETLYRAYRIERRGAEVACGFRDHTLSDLIGFSYASWAPEVAAADFVHRLTEAGHRAARHLDGVDPTIFVILDGENAWEHYHGQGRPFLRALYARLQESRELQSVTMSEACAAPSQTLSHIFPGSWINGDFYIWIGHDDDRRAWGQLAAARRALESAPPTLAPAARARAHEEMLIAEGSDWFWWYGDDHSSDHDRDFDELFRRHVQNVYRALGAPIPDELLVTNITTQPVEVRIDPPTGLIHPVIDGETTSYFEWLGAGSVEIDRAVGAMHQVADGELGLRSIDFGFDLQHLYLRVSGTVAMDRLLGQGLSLTVNFLEPAGVRLLMQPSGGSSYEVGLLTMVSQHEPGSRGCPGAAVAIGKVLELRVPFDCLGLAAGVGVSFLVALNREGLEVEHHPRNHPIQLIVPDRAFVSSHWTA